MKAYRLKKSTLKAMDASEHPQRGGYEHAQNWKSLLTPSEREKFPEGLTRIPLEETLLHYRCLFYSEDSNGKDSTMHQRYALMLYLQTRETKVPNCRSKQADHVAFLARESFDYVRQIVSASSFSVRHAAAAFQNTEWDRILELYTSFRLFQESRNRIEGMHSSWPMLDGAQTLDGGGRRISETFLTEAIIEPTTGTLSADEIKKQSLDAGGKVVQVLDYVCHVVRQLIPAHVFVLGVVPTDNELEYFGLRDESVGLCQDDVYQVFCTKSEQRVDAGRKIIRALKRVGIDANCDFEDLKAAREMGFRVHAMLVNLRFSKERAVRCFDDNIEFINALVNVSLEESDERPLLQTFLAFIDNIQAYIHKSHAWKDTYDEKLSAFRRECTKGEPIPTNEACIHFVNAFLMVDAQKSIQSVVNAILVDHVKQDKSQQREILLQDHLDVFKTSLSYDLAQQYHDKDPTVMNHLIIFGERSDQIRHALATAMTVIFDQLQKCARTLVPCLKNVAEDQPTIPLPSGRLQQSQPQHVAPHLHGGCTIIDIGFRSDGCYKPEYRQGLLTIEFYQGEEGPSLDEAIVAVAQRQSNARVSCVRLEGSALISNARCSITVECQLPRNISAQAKKIIRYETFVDGINISVENPVAIVAATDDTEELSAPIPFTRIAQYVSGLNWRKENRGEPIADNAIQVAAAVEKEYELKEKKFDFNVFNSLVYQSSTALLYHLDHVRDCIISKWEKHLSLYTQSELSKCLLDLLTSPHSRVLALTNTELHLAKKILEKLQFDVSYMSVDNRSFVTIHSKLAELAAKPSISFVHFQILGHLDDVNVEQICRTVNRSAVRVLVVASPSTREFSKVSLHDCVNKTSAAVLGFQVSRTVPFVGPLFVATDTNDNAVTRGEFHCSVETFVKRYEDRHVVDFVNSVCDSRARNPLTIICLRGRQFVRIQDAHDLRARSQATLTHSLRHILGQPENVVVIVDNITTEISILTHNEKTVDAQILYVPNPSPNSFDDLFQPTANSSTSVLSPEWEDVQRAMSENRRKYAIDFTDFVCVVPECEWLDHRSRVQLYLQVVWNVPQSITDAVAKSIRNVMSMPLTSTVVLSRDLNTNQSDGSAIEIAPSYSEMVQGGSVILGDVLRSSFSARSDIPWNTCEAVWSIAAPFSSAKLTQILSVYPYRLRLLMTLGPSLFHTLTGVALFIDDVPMSWAADVAERLSVFTRLQKYGQLPPDRRLASLSVVKWLFISQGWNDKIGKSENIGIEDRFGKPIVAIEFGANDFIALDQESIVMDILEHQSQSSISTTTVVAMSPATRHGIALMLATLEGSMDLFTKQPQILDYFLLTEEQGGITTHAARNLMDTLFDPSHAMLIGAPFLNIIKDASLVNAAALRKEVPGVNNLWLWCHKEARTDAFALDAILGKLSRNAWGLLLATTAPEDIGELLKMLTKNAQRNNITIEEVLSECASFSAQTESALDSVVVVVLQHCDKLNNDTAALAELCPSLNHLFQILEVTNQRDCSSLDALRFARPEDDDSSTATFPQFRVELEGPGHVLTFALMQLSLFSEDASDSHFLEAVIFFGRCFSVNGRRHLLRTITELLIDLSADALPSGIHRPSHLALQIAAAALWLHLPTAPCPLSTDSHLALKKMKVFLRIEGGFVQLPNFLFRDWTITQRQAAFDELRDVASVFVCVVKTEFEIVPHIALALVGWDHYLPMAFLQSLRQSGVVDSAPEECHTNIVVQPPGFPAYQLIYSLRPLPQQIAHDFFAAGQYAVDNKPQSFDISHGVSSGLIERNLSFLVHIDYGRRDEEVPAALCIILWLKALGLFANLSSDAECEAAIINLVKADQKDLIEEGLKKFKNNQELSRQGEVYVTRTTFPSFMELQVLRKSALLRLFDHTSLESVLYTIQTLSSVLCILPPTDGPRSAQLLRYRGEHHLAVMVLKERNEGAKVAKMATVMEIIACEVGFRLGQLWKTLTDQMQRVSIAQSVVNGPFSLLNESTDKATKMMTVIADIALNQLDDDPTNSALLCSALTLAIGFQDESARLHLLIPLFALMARKHLQVVDNHNIGAVRPRLTSRVAAEVRWWRRENLLTLDTSLECVFNDGPFVEDPLTNVTSSITEVAALSPYGGRLKNLVTSALPRRKSERIPRRFSLFRDVSVTTNRNSSQEHSTESLNASAGHLDPNDDSSGQLSSRFSTNTNLDETNLRSAVIDVSSILKLTIAPESIISGGSLSLAAGLACVLTRSHSGELKIEPLKDIRKSNGVNASTMCCHFDNFGEAWEFCLARRDPSTLVGRGFLLRSSPSGNWRMIIGLDHEKKYTSLRPWHALAFHSLIGLPLQGKASEGGGPHQLFEWVCRRVCAGLENLGENTQADTVQQMITALVSCRCAKKEPFYAAISQFLTKTIAGIRNSNGNDVIESAIYGAFNAISDAERAVLEECEVLEPMSKVVLITALRNSLHFIASLDHHLLSDIITPGVQGAKSHEATRIFFESPLSTRDLKNRFFEFLFREWKSSELVTRLSDRLRPNAPPLEYPSLQGFASSALHFTQKKSVDSTIVNGSGIQTGDKYDVFFAVADAYTTSDLAYIPIERKERYNHSRGALLGFIIPKPLIYPSSSHPGSLRQANEALVVQWVLQVLRSPILPNWKEWFLQHLRPHAVWVPPISNDKECFQHLVIVHLLALRCELGSAREVLLAAFGKELPAHCVRCNRVYGVIAMWNPPVADWINEGYDVKEYTFVDLPQDEEVFRTIIGQFNPLTSHVVVRGFDKAPISDTLLKWLCEYTFRYPWRFVVLVNCDTTMNLPENRDRVTNLIPARKRRMETITLPIKKEYTDWESMMNFIPQTGTEAFQSLRSCSWSKEVETLLLHVQPSNPNPAERILLIHLISPPGGGKSTLMQDLESHKEIGKFVRFDCSDDRLVEEALQSLLIEALVGVQSESVVLVADEYHMLPERKKIEFMQWAVKMLKKVKIVMIANRADPLDKKLISDVREAFPQSAHNIRCIEGRISALKVKEVIHKTYNLLTEDQVSNQARSFYTFLATLRGMLGDDAVSLRMEEHFPRVDKNQRVNKIEFVKKMQDKLLMFGLDSISRILNEYEQITVSIEKQTSNMSVNDRRIKIRELYLSSIRKGSATRLLVFTAMLVPLLLYEEPLFGPNQQTTFVCDQALCYRDVVELTGNARRAPASVRLFLWIHYVHMYVGIVLPEGDAPVIFNLLRRLKMVDFPDFPILEGESSLRFYPLDEQRTTFVDYHDLTDLDWMYRTLARRDSVNWIAVARTWEHTPVTDSEKLCAIIDLAGSTTVFNAMSPSNVLQLLKRNPTGTFKDAVVAAYPIDRIMEEMNATESPYFFAAYSDLVMIDPTGDQAPSTFDKLVLYPGSGHRKPTIATAFLFWISQHGSLVASVPGQSVERTEMIVRLISTKSEMLNFSTPQHADLWRGKYLARAADFFTESGEALIPIARAVEIVKGTSTHHRLHDKWPPNLKLLHRIMTSSNSMLTDSEATHFLKLGVLKQSGVPSRLVGALLQAEPPGWLDKEHQLQLLACDIHIRCCDVNNDEKFALNARRNIIIGLRAIHDKAKEVKIQYHPILNLYEELQKRADGTTIVTEGRAIAPPVM
ncbi:Hypothetical protein, putative [Bodo saltans]|uniref:AAA+ ATPase domain-containing protein n=1 Tax=Bodo saltans TaxID=75058 RepID=A0A0S4J9F8_BODSA|nr:Hypothetical protein, putative [Bodo saltans]|eukprot:CUG86993.1 Hypothetical protein, putative [Bodo saltans]